MLPSKSQNLTVLLGVLVAAAAVLGGRMPALGADFRLDNKVFVGKATEPECQGTTIFQSGRVYDFLDNPPETVVYDPAAERFILLDAGRRLRAEVPIKEVMAFNARQKEWATGHPNRVLQFFGQPQFDESYSKAAGELTLSSPWVIYKIKLAAAGKGIVEQNREFCDWYARLNAVMTPRARPPFARLLVNQAIAQRGATARQIELTLVSKKGDSTTRRSSAASTNWCSRSAGPTWSGWPRRSRTCRRSNWSVSRNTEKGIRDQRRMKDKG